MIIVLRMCQKCNEEKGHKVLGNNQIECRECGTVQAGSLRTHRSVDAWREPLLSDAAGVHPDQIAEAKAAFPHHEYTEDGRMIFRSARHRRQCLKDIGMVDKSSFC